MEKILSKIVSRNQKKIDGIHYISTLLYFVLTDSNDTSFFIKRNFDGVEFIEIDSIPKPIRTNFYLESIKVFHSNFERENQVQQSQKNPLNPSEIENNPISNSVRHAEFDMHKALARSPDYEIEFIDYFTDQEIIAIKATTLSIIRQMQGTKMELPYLRAVFVELIKRKVKSELPLTAFAEFSKKVQWFVRVGPKRGLIDQNQNPNI